jgi:hypothetical protein
MKWLRADFRAKHAAFKEALMAILHPLWLGLFSFGVLVSALPGAAAGGPPGKDGPKDRPAKGNQDADKPAAKEPPGADEPWQPLFADQRWYKSARGKEQVFRGKLRAVPNAGGFSTLMRTSYYALGDRTIHTGAKKVAALDRLVGKDVEIRGKPVEMNLEGRFLKEIWPAAVRPAGAATEEPKPPVAELTDPDRLAKAELVVRGLGVDAAFSRGATTRQQGIGILAVLKKPAGLKLGNKVYVQVAADSEGVPKRECTVYLVRKGKQWVLLGSDVKTGVSHVVAEQPPE